MSSLADRLCARINDRLGAVPFSYVEGESQHTLAVAGRDPIRFPQSAGGRVHGGSASWVSKKHEAGAIHEPGLIAALLALTEEDRSIRTVLDIGALYGYVSFVARSLFDQADVHAFEANPRSYKALSHNIEANRTSFGDSVHAHNCALSDQTEKQVAMRIHRMRIDALSGDEKEIGQRGRDFEIDVWSLDDFCREHALTPDLIKLDVEGYQAKIIPGAHDVITRSRPVILMEFDAPGAVNDFGVTNRDVIEPLMEDGYSLIWGKHRYTHVPFQVLRLDELTDKHEANALGILVP